MKKAKQRPVQESAAKPQDGAPENIPATPETTRRRRLWFRAIALFVPILGLGVLEFFLRLAGYGYEASFFVRHPAAGPDKLVENQRFAWRFMPRTMARFPEPVVISRKKPEGTCRIFVFGESAAIGLQQGHGYGFPFDRPLLALARRVQQVQAQLQSFICEKQKGDRRCNLPFHHLARDLHPFVRDYPLKPTLSRLENYSRVFDQLRHALRMAPISSSQGLNHEGQALEMKTLQQQVHAFAAHLRARPDYSSTPPLQKMIEQIDHYGPKLFADPLVVSTPQGSRTIQPQRTNNVMERFFRDLKRDCRHKTGCHSLGRTLRTMLPDTPLVKNLQNPDYLKILLDGRPSLEALFAELDPATVREELFKAQQIPEHVPRALQRFIDDLPDPTPIRNFINNTPSNRLSSP